MLVRCLLVLAVLPAAGCLPTSRVPPITTPQGNSVLGKGVTVGVGLELMPRGALVEDGTTREAGYGPRVKIPLLQLLSISGRDSISDNCDVGLQLNVGSTGGDIRCGLGDVDRTIAIATGATFKWWQGLVGRTEIQTGVHKDGFVAFASTGVTYGIYSHAIPLGENTPLEDLLVGPHEPYLRVSQSEVAWSSSLTLGFPAGDRHGPTIFVSASFDRPLLTTRARFDCVGCEGDRSFASFEPGFRIGGMIGVAAMTSR